MKSFLKIRHAVLFFGIALCNHGSVLAQNAVTPSLEGYNNLLSIELKSGDMSIYETSKGSNFAISIDMKDSPLCKTEVVAEPVRILIDCPGRILQGARPIKLTTSKMAKQVRFGYSGDRSKIVIDMNVDVFAVQAPKAVGDKSIFVFGGKGQTMAVAEPDPDRKAKLIEEMVKQSGGPVVVHTPIPPPQMLHGETDLTSLIFNKNPKLNGPTIKITLRAGRKVELKQKSATQYVLRIAATRVISPIFTEPQTAPDGFAPFSKVQLTEIIPAAGPVDLSLQIELSSPAELQVKQSAGDIELYVGQSEAGEE